MSADLARPIVPALRALAVAAILTSAAGATASATTSATASPEAAAAGSGGGGAGLGGTPTLGGSLDPSPVSSTGAHLPVSAVGDGITLRTTSTAMLGGGLTFSGHAAADAGRTIVIERSGRETHWRWRPTAEATVAADGVYAASWQTDHIGRFAVRALARSPSSAGAVRAAVAAAVPVTTSLTVTVYLPTRATLYGPGFYGRRTACGQRLTPSTIGVANRSLRCGEKVALLYDGRTIVVPVIDRGPFANGASWDLTMATGRTLGMTGTEELGAVSLPAAPGR